jgi:large repetitive protein
MPQSFQFTANGGLAITITGALGVSNQTMPNGVIGQPYSHQFLVVNGVAPFVWSIVSGTFPPGLSISPTGLVSGTPTTAGTFTPPVLQVTSS